MKASGSPAASLRPGLFLDRDGTLTDDGGGYTHRVEDLVWMPGAREAILRANAAGALVIVATNQSGIGRGLFTEADMAAFHNAMARDLAAVGARIDAIYHCPYHPSAAVERFRVADHPDRKPNPGMLLRALAEHPVDPRRAAMLGDQAHDAEAGVRAGIEGIVVAPGMLLSVVEALVKRWSA